LDKLTLLTLGFLISSIGYGWVAVTEDIVSPSALPALLCMGMGLASAQLGSQVLLAQEAPARIRGSAYGLQALCGGFGILALSAIGGRLYDAIGPQAPFVAVAACNVFVLLCAVAYRVVELKRPAPVAKAAE
jgi:predicted MFS family arabinose efflux permease